MAPYEPFHIKPTGDGILVLLANIAFMGLNIAAGWWAIREKSKRYYHAPKPDCNDPVVKRLEITFFSFTFVLIGLYWLVLNRKTLRSSCTATFKFLKPISKTLSARIRLHPINLEPTITDLRALVKKVESGTAPLDAPSTFLRTARGQTFLRRALRRIKRLHICQGQLVRVHWARAYLLFNFVLFCNVVSLAGAYQATFKEKKCGVGALVFTFLNDFGLTFLAVISAFAFAGYSNYAELVGTSEEKCRLTDEEKFLISLVAANSDAKFRGLYSGEGKSYADVEEDGEVEAFLTLHSSLFAYCKPTVVGDGEVRFFDPDGTATLENYSVAGTGLGDFAISTSSSS